MGIKNYGVVDLLSVGSVVLAQPVGCKGRAHVSTRRVDCGRGRFSARRTSRWDLGGAGRAVVRAEAGLDFVGCAWRIGSYAGIGV